MKCTKVKNPCKICFQGVTKKNGLQCQGACHGWAHYKCLKYTPGKIQDIKAGVIKVTCPCPDCKTSESKEVLTDAPFMCTNSKCPAYKLPICQSQECPSKNNPIPIYPPPPLEYGPESSLPNSLYPAQCRCSSPKQAPSAVKFSPVNNHLPKSSPQPESPKHPPKSTKHEVSPVSKGKITPPRSQSPLNSKCCLPPCIPTCPRSRASNQNMKNSKRCCMSKRSQSCSSLVKKTESSGKQQAEQMRAISSDSQVPSAGSNGVDRKLLYAAIENLCNTVGQLSTQLKDLMCKMQQGYK